MAFFGFPSMEDEADGIARYIINAVRDSKGHIRFGDVAVFVLRNAHSLRIADALATRGIPVHNHTIADFVHSPEIQFVTSFLTAVSDTSATLKGMKLTCLVFAN